MLGELRILVFFLILAFSSTLVLDDMPESYYPIIVPRVLFGLLNPWVVRRSLAH